MTMKRIFTLLLSLTLALSCLAGCSGGSSSSSSAGSSSSAQEEIQPMDLTGITDPFLATAGLKEDAVVARVGGSDITAGELLYWLGYNIGYSLDYYGVDTLPWDLEIEGVPLSQSMLDGALQLAAYNHLLPQLAAKEGLSLPEDTDQLLAGDRERLLELLGSPETLEHYFWLQMKSADLFDVIYKQMECGSLIHDHYYGEGGPYYPTDAEVKRFVQEDLGIYRAKHILLVTKDMDAPITNEEGKIIGYTPLDEATIAEKKQLADDLLEQLHNAQDQVALFDQLMQEHSEDGGLAANPDGYTTTRGKMVPEFEQTALALDEGAISGVVESVYGYHILLRLPLEDLDSYRSQLVAVLAEEQSRVWLEEYGVETTELMEQIDVPDYWSKCQSLQLAAYNDIQAVLAKLQEESASQSGSQS